MNINDRKNYWKDRIALWEKSGLTQTEYCRQNKISRQLFSEWKTKLSKNNENKFIEVPIKLKQGFSFLSGVELIIKEKYRIEIHPDFNPDTLKKLLKTLEG